jgi:phage baseplate assembly protein W
MIQKKQTYADLPFFMSSNAFTRDINLIRDLSAIRQSIKNIIMTNNGERSFDFAFGGSLYEMLFENYTLEMILDVQSKIATNIKTYEQRVELNDIRILDNPEENSVNIVVDFFVPELAKNDVIIVKLARNR